jgi:hypothetical protein
MQINTEQLAEGNLVNSLRRCVGGPSHRRPQSHGSCAVHAHVLLSSTYADIHLRWRVRVHASWHLARRVRVLLLYIYCSRT